MKNNYCSFKSFQNILLKPKKKTETISQIIYGENFRILSKNKNWLKIRTQFDKYNGYIENKGMLNKFNPSHKVFKRNSIIYKAKEGRMVKTHEFLSFASKIKVLNKKKKFIEFENNRWIKKSDTKKITHKIKNFKKIFRYFLNSKYKWGGKHFSGIDCSGLLQIFFYYNNEFCPRDTKDQLIFFKRMKKDTYKIKKKIIFWKGHVAICINKKLLIHAYGPRKKVVIMNIKKTIKKIFEDTKLKPIYL